MDCYYARLHKKKKPKKPQSKACSNFAGNYPWPENGIRFLSYKQSIGGLMEWKIQLLVKTAFGQVSVRSSTSLTRQIRFYFKPFSKE